jgi:hypothetical protein
MVMTVIGMAGRRRLVTAKIGATGAIRSAAGVSEEEP